MEIVLGILGLLVTSVGVYVAFREYKKRKHDPNLYERRMAIFDAVMRTLGIISEKGDISGEQLREFLKSTREADFLFNKDISTFLNELYEKMVDLWHLNVAVRETEDQNVREELIRKRGALVKSFMHHIPEVKKKFSKLLRVES